jgi:hypothetical protein
LRQKRLRVVIAITRMARCGARIGHPTRQTRAPLSGEGTAGCESGTEPTGWQDHHGVDASMRALGFALLSLLAAACSAPRNTPPAGEQGAASDSTTLARLEAEVRALARADGCEAAGECRVAPLGARPCGGPRDYLVYCARRTDSVALFRKLGELQRAEQAYNERQGLMGTCEFRTPPGVAFAGGACRAAR